MAADTEQPLLQVAIDCQARSLDDAVDPAVDHDRDHLGDLGRDADVLLDDEDGNLAFLS